MRYLPDSNTLIAVLERQEPIFSRVRHLHKGDAGLSSIVAFELYYGAYSSSRQKENLARFDAIAFPIVEFDREDARRSGEVRAALKRLGTPIGPYDILIAGQALARGLILLTRNIREFERVKGLKVENWQA